MPNSKSTHEAVLSQRIDDHQRQIDNLASSVATVAQGTTENNKQIAVLISMHEASERSRTQDSATMRDMALNISSMQKEMGSYGGMLERVTKLEGQVEQALHKSGNALNGVQAIAPLENRVKAVEKMLDGYEDKKVADAKKEGEQDTALLALTGRADTVDAFILTVKGAEKGIKGLWAVLIALGGGAAFMIGTALTLYNILHGGSVGGE